MQVSTTPEAPETHVRTPTAIGLALLLFAIVAATAIQLIQAT